MKTLVDLIEDLVAVFPSDRVNERTVGLYAEHLHDLEIEHLNVAVNALLREPGRKFLPTIGEIREAANMLTDELLGIPSKDEGWNHICRYMCDDGPPAKDRIEFIEECVRLMGGWYMLGQGLEADRPYRRREFMEIYDRQVERLRVERNRSASDAMMIEQMKQVRIAGGNGKPQIGDGQCR